MASNKLKHVGVIMDGNRRWAKKNGLVSVLKGHEQGVRKLMELCTWCQELGIPFLSVYAFSTENWNRSETEINGLFLIMEGFFQSEISNCIEKGIKIKVVGDISKLKERQREIIFEAEKNTMNCDKLTVQIAISYGGRDELTRAVKKIVNEIDTGKIQKECITEYLIESYLDTAEIPMIDMVIRTGGNHRLSNFFTWQSAYSELYFCDTLWPDFTKREFKEFVDEFRRAEINMGR